MISPGTRQAAIQLVRSGRIQRLRWLAHSGDPQGCRQLAAWLARTGEISELRERAASGDRFARRQLADWLVGQGRFDEAVDEIRPLAESGDTGAGRRLARLLAGRGRIEEALSVVESLPAGWGTPRTVSGWLGSQDRFDLLRQLASSGDAAARSELAWKVRNLWRAARVAEAVDLLTSVDMHDEYLGESLVRIAGNDWRYGRLGVRDVVIDLLGTVDHPLCRRVRAGLLLAQGRDDEAITELRSLAAKGDPAADRDLADVLRRERPVRELRILDHTVGGYTCAVAFSPDGSMLATCGDDTILVWHPRTGELLHTLRSRGAVSAVAFSPDGAVLTSNGGIGGGAQSWNPRTGEHLGVVDGVAFRADRALVATGEHLRRLGDSGADAFAVHPDGDLLATARGHLRPDAGVQLWNPATGRRVRHIDTAANALAFSPDGTVLATANDADGVVRLWDVMDVRRGGTIGA